MDTALAGKNRQLCSVMAFVKVGSTGPVLDYQYQLLKRYNNNIYLYSDIMQGDIVVT